MPGIYLPEPKADEMDQARDFLIAQDERRQKPPEPRFPNVSCSQCGREFGPGNHGFSHCSSHRGIVKAFPEPQPCHHCDAKFAGSHCPLCGAERPAYTALKRLTEERKRELESCANAARFVS